MRISQYEREMRRGAANLRRFEAAWFRYINALARFCDKQPDGRANYGRRRAMKAARRNLEQVCAAIGVSSPV